MKQVLKICIVLLGIASLCLLYGFLIEPKRLVVRNILIQSEHIQSPYKVVLLSDIHIGGMHITARRVAKIVDKINDLRPDIVLIPGDFVNGHDPRVSHSRAFNDEIALGISHLSAIQSVQGTFATIGNHDVWYDAGFIEAALTQNGVSVLANKAQIIDEHICLVGLADHTTQTEDISVFSNCKNKAIIALMHSPDSFQYLRPGIALAVAGHTHGGQINLPLIGRRVTATNSGNKYAYGLVKVNGVLAFVTAGIGTSILPARFRAPPELVLIELTP